MNIIIINGSPRKNGLTAGILHIIEKRLADRGADVSFYDLSALEYKPCIGCCKCYEKGRCIFDDDAERLSREIAASDGLVIGSPTYASNVSGILKLFIDRGHFVIEQLLHGKYAMTVATGENYGSKDTSKILHDLMLYSGAMVSDDIIRNAPFGSSVTDSEGIAAKADRLYDDILKKRMHPVQNIIHKLIFSVGIAPFVKKKGEKYRGVSDRWDSAGIM